MAQLKLPILALIVCGCHIPISATEEYEERRVYSIGAGAGYGGNVYVDDSGYHMGFFKDLVDEVCREAGIDCRFILVPWEWCWKSQPGQHQRGGEALLDGWIDACISPMITVNRVQVFRFASSSYLQYRPTRFYVRSNDSLTEDDLTRKKIGFMDAAITDVKCVQRELGITIPMENVVHFTDPEKLKDGLKNGQVDVAFFLENYFEEFNTAPNVPFKPVLGSYKCALGGNSLLARKDSDLLAKWDEGFSKLVSDGRFAKLCDEAQKKHAPGRSEVLCYNVN